MKCRDLFALGVRLLGVWLVMRGLLYVEAFVDGKLYPSSDRTAYHAAGTLIYATFDFGLAAFFLFWTHIIVGWTYGEEPGIGIDPQRPAAVDVGTGGQLDEPEALDGP
jgi:hypothetical protein